MFTMNVFCRLLVSVNTLSLEIVLKVDTQYTR